MTKKKIFVKWHQASAQHSSDKETALDENESLAAGSQVSILQNFFFKTT
jgi:hypothetical protein